MVAALAGARRAGAGVGQRAAAAAGGAAQRAAARPGEPSPAPPSSSRSAPRCSPPCSAACCRRCAPRSPTVDRLRDGGRGTTRRRHWARNGLVVAQTAMALVLLIGSGLLVRSFQRAALGRPRLRHRGPLHVPDRARRGPPHRRPVVRALPSGLHGSAAGDAVGRVGRRGGERPAQRGRAEPPLPHRGQRNRSGHRPAARRHLDRRRLLPHHGHRAAAAAGRSPRAIPRPRSAT